MFHCVIKSIGSGERGEGKTQTNVQFQWLIDLIAMFQNGFTIFNRPDALEMLQNHRKTFQKRLKIAEKLAKNPKIFGLRPTKNKGGNYL